MAGWAYGCKAVRLAVELAGPGALVDGQLDRMNGTRSPHVVSVGATQRSAAGAA